MTVFRMLLVNVATVVLTSMVFGALSDRLRQRKVFVFVSTFVLALAHVLAAFSHDMAT